MDSASKIKIELTKDEIKALLSGLPVWRMSDGQPREGKDSN